MQLHQNTAQLIGLCIIKVYDKSLENTLLTHVLDMDKTHEWRCDLYNQNYIINLWGKKDVYTKIELKM